jgi:hypothetical protein
MFRIPEKRLSTSPREVKVKVKLFLHLTKQHAVKTYWVVEVQLHVFLTPALDAMGSQIYAQVSLPLGKESTVPTG